MQPDQVHIIKTWPRILQTIPCVCANAKPKMESYWKRGTHNNYQFSLFVMNPHNRKNNINSERKRCRQEAAILLNSIMNSLAPKGFSQFCHIASNFHILKMNSYKYIYPPKIWNRPLKNLLLRDPHQMCFY